MPGPGSAESIARELIEAFCAADTQRMRSLLADDLRAYITNREGGVNEVGAEEYLQRVAAMDLPSAQLKLAITQVVAPRPEMVIAMVEVNAARGGRTLHNHAPTASSSAMAWSPRYLAVVRYDRNRLTRKMEISWARGSGPWPSAPVRACGGGVGQAAWAGPDPSGAGSGMRHRVTSKPRDPSLPTWWATWRRTSRWRS